MPSLTEKNHLRRILRAALAVAATTPGIVASCGGEPLLATPPPDGAAEDASVTTDAVAPMDASVPPPLVDAGRDATPSCDACACDPAAPTTDVAIPPGYDASAFVMCDGSPCDGTYFYSACSDYCAPATPLGCVVFYCGERSTRYPLYCQVRNDGGSLGATCIYQEDPYPDGGSANCAPFFGRRPEGLEAIGGARGAPLGVFFANTSYLEAASVDAFLTLHDELAMHGAPPELLAQARRSAGDEVRHARGAALLAERFGALPGAWSERPRITRPAARSLEEIARENAIEGCVQETWGALTGLWAADRAQDPEVRRVFQEHAPDEIRHAELAWSVAGWIRGMLDPAACRRVDAAMHDAA
ncbi:MAG TPA: ferritin-like domain-containing protein, partial [Labilithrix sp.]|nr:ferritin-like domain-containing protein [Labilithrix sp.]